MLAELVLVGVLFTRAERVEVLDQTYLMECTSETDGCLEDVQELSFKRLPDRERPLQPDDPFYVRMVQNGEDLPLTKIQYADGRVCSSIPNDVVRYKLHPLCLEETILEFYNASFRTLEEWRGLEVFE